MIDEDNKLDEMLLRRDVPALSTNLSYRIRQAAKDKAAVSTHSLVDDLWRLFIIPKPAYVTAFCLFFGLVMGMYTGVEESTTSEWFLFLETQEEDWL